MGWVLLPQERTCAMRLRRLIFGCAVISGLTFAVAAQASVVDNDPCNGNNAYCRINIFNDSKLYWASGSYMPFGFVSATPSDGLDGTIDSSGVWTYDSQAGALDTISTGYYLGANLVSMRPQISSSTTTASFDPRAGYNTVNLTLRMRLQFFWSGQTNTCYTSYFNVTVTTGKSCSWCATPANYNYDSDGGFKVVAQDFTIPTLPTGTNCDSSGNRSSIESAFVLNGTSNHGMIVYGRMDNPSVLTGS